MTAFLLSLALAGITSAAEVPEIALEPHRAALRIAVTGDTGAGAERVAAGIRRVHAEKPLDAIILTGDNFYPCGVTSENDPRWSLVLPLASVGVPVFPVLGNHDYCGKADPDAQVRASAALANWRFPARQFAVRSLAADFAFIDTTPHVNRQSDVAAIIREAFRSSKTPWRVVVGHHPVFSSGYHGYFPRDEVARMREIVPTLRETRIDLYVCGHDHHLELIRGRMMHLVSGAGSAPIPPVKLRIRTVFPAEIRRERVGFALLEIDAKSIRVRFYDEKGRARSDWIARSRTWPGRSRTTSFPSSPRRD